MAPGSVEAREHPCQRQTCSAIAVALVLAIPNVQILIKTYGWDVGNPSCPRQDVTPLPFDQPCCAPSTAKQPPRTATTYETPPPTKTPTGSLSTDTTDLNA